MRVLAAVALLLFAGCFEGDREKIVDGMAPKIAVVNPGFVVARAVSKEPIPGAATGSVYQQTYYFTPSGHVLDLNDLDLRTARSREFIPTSEEAVITVELTDTGSRKFRAWTRANIGKQLGFFVDGKLISAPFIETELSGTILLQDHYTKDQAKAVLARLKKGGAA
jgi:preprotein translocase subunit SecD